MTNVPPRPGWEIYQHRLVQGVGSWRAIMREWNMHADRGHDLDGSAHDYFCWTCMEGATHSGYERYHDYPGR